MTRLVFPLAMGALLPLALAFEAVDLEFVEAEARLEAVFVVVLEAAFGVALLLVALLVFLVVVAISFLNLILVIICVPPIWHFHRREIGGHR